MNEFIGRVILFFGLFSTSLSLSSADRFTQASISFSGTSESLVSTDSGAFSFGVLDFSPRANFAFFALGALDTGEALLLAAWERFGLLLFPLLLRSEALGVGGELVFVYW